MTLILRKKSDVHLIHYRTLVPCAFKNTFHKDFNLEEECQMTESELWQAVVEHQGEEFYTVSGLPFSYQLKRGRDGSYNKELIINRRKESKTLAWSSIMLAFESALGFRGEVVPRPKALGDIRGVSYIYPLLYRFGIIEVPEKAKMTLGAKIH